LVTITVAIVSWITYFNTRAAIIEQTNQRVDALVRELAQQGGKPSVLGGAGDRVIKNVAAGFAGDGRSRRTCPSIHACVAEQPIVFVDEL
jgi:hypothetical protein